MAKLDKYCLVTWKGNCPDTPGFRMHMCIIPDESHAGKHECQCGETK